MNKKSITTVVLGILLVFCFCLPAVAEEIEANVNGDSFTFKNSFYVEGVSMVTVDDLVELMGASAERISDTQVKIVENDLSLLLTLMNKEALFGDSKVSLAQEPVIIQGNTVHIPLRSVAEIFGFKVGWDNQNKTVTLERVETRDGMTASELLVKSNTAAQKVNTYSMEGKMDIVVDYKSDGMVLQTEPVQMTSLISGQIQNEPMQIYMKQNITASGEAAEQMPETVTETFITEDNMYIKIGEGEWMLLDTPIFSPEFWKQQRDIQNDPLKTAEQMSKMGVCVNFGNDITADGIDYYVINASLDMTKAMGQFNDIITQVAQSIAGSDTEGLQEQLEDILANSNMDYRCSVLINKETLFSDIIRFDADFNFKLDVPTGEADLQVPQTMEVYEKMVGEFKISNFDEPFAAPDVSNAQPLEIPQEDGLTQVS
jgi:hypothetical protein